MTAAMTADAACRCRRETTKRGRRTLVRDGGRPVLLATFRDGRLVRVQRIHWASRDRCPLPTEELDVQEWLG